MNRLVAEFDGPDALRRGLAALRPTGHLALDALTPAPVDGLEGLQPDPPSRIRLVMLLAGFGTAVAAFGLQYWSSVYDYPLNSGGRPLNSWPVFLLVPFEVGILAAGIGGFLAFMHACGLPRLHHPVFDAPHIERATQDRYFLLAAPAVGASAPDLRRVLEASGAITVAEVRP